MNNVMKMVDTHTCTGCSLCLSFCPYGNISMEQGDLGFPVPNIKDHKLCSGCSKCLKACPFSDEFEED